MVALQTISNGADTVQTEELKEVRDFIECSCLAARRSLDNALTEMLEISNTLTVSGNIQLSDYLNELLQKSIDEMTKSTHSFMRFNLQFMDDAFKITH